MQSSGGLIPGTALRQGHDPLRPARRWPGAAVKLAGGSTPIVRFDMGGTSNALFHAEPPAGKWNGRGDGVCRRKWALERLRRRRSPSPLQGDTTADPHVAAGGGSRLPLRWPAMAVGPASGPGPIQARLSYARRAAHQITDATCCWPPASRGPFSGGVRPRRRFRGPIRSW